MPSITFGILTVSDTCYYDHSKDASGPEAVRLVTDPETKTGEILQGRVSRKHIIPDDEHSIMKTLMEWSDKDGVNVILTSGGTGFSERDVTPEATKRVISKEAPGIASAMLKHSLDVTPMAMLSRAVCGIRGKTLIINLPGSPKAVSECLSAIAVVIPHAVALILNDKPKVLEDHKNIQDGKMSDEICLKYQDLAIVLGDVANRLRQSPYPMISLREAENMLLRQVSLSLDLKAKHEMLEQVSLEKSHGRILARPINSQCNLPPFRASIKDGYAVIAEDGAGSRRVLGGVEAGHEIICPGLAQMKNMIAGAPTSVASPTPNTIFCQTLKDIIMFNNDRLPGSIRIRNGECVRINTGAPIPDEATAVVQVEDTRLTSEVEATQAKRRIETTIEILVAPKVGQDIRQVGSDIEKGAIVLREGTRIGASEMGILAACGVSNVSVTKLPIVGILSTGNELQAPGESPKPGHVYDSNKITLIATLKENGYDSLDLGIVGDDLRAMISRIEKALSIVDVLITTGSVSMGDKDMLKPILKEIFQATIHFGRVSLKPGKPTTFATCEYHGEKKFFLCLPGNPVSAMVTARLFAIPLLHRLSLNNTKATVIAAKLTTDYDLDPRPEYARAILEWENDDIPNAHITGNQISSRLLSCKSANALLMLPGRNEEKSSMKKGDRVSAMLIGF